jgi:hypothetical protein
MITISKYLKEVPYNFKLAFPVILGMLGHTFVAFADNIMVGQLGPTELAAVSLGNSFLFIAMSLGNRPIHSDYSPHCRSRWKRKDIRGKKSASSWVMDMHCSRSSTYDYHYHCKPPDE